MDQDNTTQAPITGQVLIAGGGPVGITLAMELASRGIASIVFEALPEILPNPRCNTTNARTMEIFRRLGCADAVRAAGLPGNHSTDAVYMTAFNGAEVIRFSRPTPDDIRAGNLHGIGANWPTPELPHFISQLAMEPVLRRFAVEQRGIDLRLGWEVVDFSQHETGVTLRARELATGREQEFQADYLVGADGAASQIRRGIGARLEGIPEFGHTCSVFLRAPRLGELARAHPGWMFRFIGGGTIMVAIDGAELWLVHVWPPAGTAIDDFDFEPMMFADLGERFEYEVINISRWTSRAMVANTYRDQRVFLAGDAAHIWIPMGGFGMNAGVGDAVALGWMLAGVLQGWLAPACLDAYQAERQPLGAQVATQAKAWGEELWPLLRTDAATRDRLAKDPVARVAHAEKLRVVNTSEWENIGLQLGVCYTASPLIVYDDVPPPEFRLSEYRESSAPGVRAPHLWRADGSALQDHFGSGFTLLRIGAAPPAAVALIAAARARSVPFTVVDVPEPDAVAKYQGYGLVLVRPDQHIAWRGQADPAQPEAILDRIAGLCPAPAGAGRPQIP